VKSHTFTVPGRVYSDYLDPRLGTEMAVALAPFYVGWRPKGRGMTHTFTWVPDHVFRDLLEDMGNVAYLRVASDPEDYDSKRVGYAMQDLLERLWKMVEP
jgi:hypothetical protein